VSVVINGDRGTITIPAGTLASLVTAAAERVDGARVRRGRRHLDVEVEDGHARVAVELVARYGTILPEVAREVQEQVTDALTTMCGMVVDAVDVEVEEVE
jgi:uncharacterized alkaline shock family protein YloU